MSSVEIPQENDIKPPDSRLPLAASQTFELPPERANFSLRPKNDTQCLEGKEHITDMKTGQNTNTNMDFNIGSNIDSTHSKIVPNTDSKIDANPSNTDSNPSTIDPNNQSTSQDTYSQSNLQNANPQDTNTLSNTPNMASQIVTSSGDPNRGQESKNEPAEYNEPGFKDILNSEPADPRFEPKQNSDLKLDYKDELSEFKPDLSKPPTRTKEDHHAVPITRQDSEFSIAEPDEDVKSDGSGDLQFRKKDFSKSRTQSFQSVLSSASLKSLKQQFTAPNHPQLHRNPSTVSQGHTKNFQSFIQAPVLSSVTNLRTSDIEIGQRLPFDHRNPYENKPLDADSTSLLADAASLNPADSQTENGESAEAEDIYKEETTLQQQKLTLNALKKLSLSLAPIIRSDEDDDEGSSRQLTTKSLNVSRQESRVDLKEARSKPLAKVSDKRPKPYQPAEVDLSSFSSLTRQSKHMGEALESKPSASETIRANKPKETNSSSEQFPERPHNPRSANSEATIKQIPEESLPSQPESGSERPQSQSQSQSQGQSQSQSHGMSHMQRSQQRNQVQPKMNGESQPHKSPNLQQRTGFAPMNPRTFPRSSMQINTMNGISTLGNGTKDASKKPTMVKMPDKKLQQINGFRSPMYVPAVLRKTTEENMEYSQSEGDGYFDQRNFAEANMYGESSSTSVKSFDSGYSTESVGSPVQKMTAPYTLNRRQYEYILRAAPTRKHWQRDESVFACGNKTCHKKFNFFERRHHCRKCGGIFCKEHTSHYLYINHLAQFTTGGRGTLSRVCDNCIEEYNEFMKHEFGVTLHVPASRESLSERNGQKTDYRKEIIVAKINNAQGDDKKVGEQLVGSVPANWSWSSF